MSTLDVNLTVLLIVVGAAASVLLAYAFTHVFWRPIPQESAVSKSEEELSQVQYMRQVRLRNLDILADSLGHPRDKRTTHDMV
ncbi:uncharacterized protein K489DRAFT_410841 [Dissoconium aciculare CBS 342.82]|uniref:Uncharacterized protein n=1 Tax=Dissoconium aciculare CBS 342.82 TaxID=1314786 RepID=A0A6J3M1H9_9PEZI|nr:uncharacterized protein K489DRAFT_410841 [Dissoconium aciculare CBS 342.82]KAF1821354.1 hypothetical protein K489DRAFT_410841 [Dissoconium aciculare CBS 342.82]